MPARASITEAEKDGSILMNSVFEEVAIQVPLDPIEAALIHVHVFDTGEAN
jgi:hypothetical protein